MFESRDIDEQRRQAERGNNELIVRGQIRPQTKNEGHAQTFLSVREFCVLVWWKSPRES